MPVDAKTDEQKREQFEKEQEKYQLVPYYLKPPLTGCHKCDEKSLPVCICPKGGSGGGSGDDESDKNQNEMVQLKIELVPDSQTPSDEFNNSRIFRAMVPLNKLKDFFDNRLEELAKEHESLPNSLDEFKQKIGYSADIVGNVLTIRLFDAKVANDLINTAYKNGLILPLTKENLENGVNNNNQNNSTYHTPSPFRLDNILHPELKPIGF